MRAQCYLAVLLSLAVGASVVLRPAGAQQSKRWAAIDPNSEVSSPVVWGATENEARQRAIEACKRLSKTCANGPAVTDDLKEVFAIVCCEQPRTGLCGLGRRQPPRCCQDCPADVCRCRLWELLRAALYPGRDRQEAVGGQTPCANRCNTLLGRGKGSDPQPREKAHPIHASRRCNGRKPHERAQRRTHRDGCRHHWRRAGRPVCGVRARPPRHQGARHRHPRQARRAVCRALSGKADLRHPRPADRHRAGADRPAAGADQALRCAVPSRPARRCPAAHRRWPLPAHHRRRHPVPHQGRDRGGRRRLVHAEAPATRRHRGLRRQVRVLRRAQVWTSSGARTC